MPALKSRRSKLLLVAIVIAVLILWKPWEGVQPGLRGLRTGADISGGSRSILELGGSRVTVQVTLENQENITTYLLAALEANLATKGRLVSYDASSRRAVIDLDMSLTVPLAQSALTGFGDVVEVTPYVTDHTRENAISLLRTRVDPYGLLDTQFMAFGETSVIFESAGIDHDRLTDLLGKQGKIEAVVDNQLALSNDGLSRIGSAVTIKEAAYVPVALTTEGVDSLNSAIHGKADHTIVIYLDRPTDAIVVFDNEVLKLAPEITYGAGSKTFHVSYQSTLGGAGFSIAVAAVPAEGGVLSPGALEYLSIQKGLKTRVILLGDRSDFTAATLQNLQSDYLIETLPQRASETVNEWVLRACGVESMPVISENMAVSGVSEEISFPFIQRSRAASLRKAQIFQSVVINMTPVPVRLTAEVATGPSFGTEFLREAPLAMGLAVLWAAVIVYVAFKRLKIMIALLAFGLVDAILTLGVISICNLPLGLPELAGLLFVVGTGFSQHLVIANEMLKGVQPKEKVSVGWRASRAMSTVYLSIFAAICLSTTIAILGSGGIRIFAIVAAFGTAIAMILTRPVFAGTIDYVLTWVAKKPAIGPTAKPAPPKPAAQPGAKPEQQKPVIQSGPKPEQQK